MKKLVSVLLAVLMLLSGFAALAEEAAPFTFRGGLHWGMKPYEVEAVEKKAFVELEEGSYTVTTGDLKGLSLSKFSNVTGSYLFVNNELAGVAMDPMLWERVDAEEIEYLRQALCLVYGEVDETLALPENVQNFLTACEYVPLASWQPAEDSCIVLLSSNGWCHLLYLDTNVDLIAEMKTTAPTPTPVPINTNGL